MGEHAARKQTGWSFGEEGHDGLPRHELPSEHLHTIESKGDPASPAWDEPGYIDPDLHHANLPDGTRYWQGSARTRLSLQARRGEERPLSPELITRITRRYYPDNAASTQEESIDPNWSRRVRSKERNVFSRMRETIWPG